MQYEFQDLHILHCTFLMGELYPEMFGVGLDKIDTLNFGGAKQCDSS